MQMHLPPMLESKSPRLKKLAQAYAQETTCPGCGKVCHRRHTVMVPHSGCPCRCRFHRCCSVALKADFRPTAALTATGRTERTRCMLTICGESVHQRCDCNVQMLLPSQAVHLISCWCSIIHLDLMDLQTNRDRPEFEKMPAAANLGEQLDVRTHPLLQLLGLCKIVVAFYAHVRGLQEALGIGSASTPAKSVFSMMNPGACTGGWDSYLTARDFTRCVDGWTDAAALWD